MAYYAIITKFHGPTNYKGSRVSASIPNMGMKVVVSYDDYEGRIQAYRNAMEALVKKYPEILGHHDWSKASHASIPSGYVFVLPD